MAHRSFKHMGVGMALSSLMAGASVLAAASPVQAQPAFFDNILYDGFYFGGQVGGISGHGSVEYYGSELGSWPNAGASAGVFLATAVVWWRVFSLGIGLFGRLLSRESVRRTLDRVTGTVLIGLGLRVALTD
jgi:hypothetical protein